MGYLVILLGLHQLFGSRPRWSPRALLLGTGLVLVGAIQVLEEGTWLHQGLNWLAWPVLVTALVLCYRDGTLAETYRCRRRRDSPSEPAT